MVSDVLQRFMRRGSAPSSRGGSAAAFPPRRGWDRRWVRRTAAALLAAGALPTVLGVLLHRELFVGTAFSLCRWWLLAGLLPAGLYYVSRARLLPAAIAAGAALLSVGDWAAHALERPRAIAPAAPVGVDLLTLNLQFKGGQPALSVKALVAHAPDLVALQEVTPAWKERLDEALSSYPHRLGLPSRDGRGFAIYSRFPLENEAALVDARGKRFAFCADVLLPERRFILCSVHLDSPSLALRKGDLTALGGLLDNARIRRRQWEQLSAFLAQRPPELTRVLAGDFNTMEADPLYRVIADDWVDAYRELTYRPGHTWPRMHRLIPTAFRIDYVFLRGAGVPVSARVLRDAGSDHLPVLTRLAL